MQLTRGRLRDAMATFDNALRLAAGQEGAVLRGTADMHVGRSALLYELDDLARRPAGAGAEPRARRAQRAAPERLSPPAWSMARLAAAEGDLDAATDLLDEADRVYVGDFSPNVRPVPAVRARVWLEQGRLADALRWVDQQELSADRRPQLPAGVRAPHPGPGPDGRGECRSGRRAPGAPRPGGGGGRPVRLADRDPGRAGAGAPAARRPAGRPGVARGGAEAGRAGGIRPDVRRRGTADGGAAGGGRRPRDRAAVRRSAPGRLPHDAAPQRRARPGRAAERP